uniref:RING-type domain-containing protein n=1 Tax=Caenorhabditis tropicalis TaxID=1561998 RepID=A0A1I7T6U8_9PELO
MSEINEEEPDEALRASRTAFDYLFKLIYPVYYFVTIPLRITNWFFTNFPIFSSVSLFLFVSTTLIVLYVYRRLSSTPRESFISYILYTVIPYGVSIVYTAVGFIFPQVHMFTRVINALLHPIKFILGFIEKVDNRAAPIRRTVEAIHGPKPPSKSSIKSIEESLNETRIQCVLCKLDDKRVLLRPCNHLCFCERCNDAFQKQIPLLCPICHIPVKSFDIVHLS